MAPKEAQTVPKSPSGLGTRGRRLWRQLHESADFADAPETVLVIEEACYLADEVDRLRRIVRAAGSDTRVVGYNGQPASMPEVDDLRKAQSILLAMLRAIRTDDDQMTASDFGRRGARGRWGS